MELTSERGIKELLNSHGFRFSKSMGQNFLVDAGVPENIAAGSGVDGSFGVLEIGPGIGALTAALSRRAARVVAVELDNKLLPILSDTLADCGNVKVIPGDILKLDIARTVREEMPGLRYAVCANLPYNITTPVLTALVEARVFETITVMVQREVARRMCAAPGTSDYGAFSVFVQYHASPGILFDVPPSSFLPPPKVTSSVVTMALRREKPAEVADEAMFFRVVRAAFAQRRKTLVNSLESVFGGRLNKDALKELVVGCGLDALARGETLGIPEFAALARKLGDRLK
ncbi:16S rRNA (adenine1518-N6/adenine1519-N6)-dimethyltransferase [Sporobacter termitidis DSM 10068]|uniref:Ribosomal RNA small subunit methyltransferase A n=1 Tax=Sporobacter termitidis DSM 10068 TaxID=1123282 RepID=A0A1M5YV99_9FIRM|nr:16S rRNA (adenine(1518)-N(6)/adenine(1519)-N(6))-dimethyltransferase RsmA [Sporobacter termitidis]SHI16007.1 16S rRNA (adenine1518-N6/adenine1519-N6)-dimethyltransferase [Sporobacter termitidis DSM 10068]